MDQIPKNIFFTLIHLFLTIHARTDHCNPHFCNKNSPVIRFPFRLQNQHPQNCGYPGFDLSCSTNHKKSNPILNIPFSGDFSVEVINYVRQEIHLQDPKGCLPNRLMSLNLTSSPFMAFHYKNFTFLNCPSEVVRNRFSIIECLSNSTTSVLATSSMNLARNMSMCRTVVTLPIPVYKPVRDDQWLSSDVDGDLRLGWNMPDCEACEARGGVCGFDNSSTSEQILCSENHRSDRTGRTILMIVALALSAPAIACSIFLSCYVCYVARRQNNRPPNFVDLNTTTTTTTTTTTPPPQPSAIAGLDESSIESYAKVVLGESRRLPGPNGVMCPICLMDYHPKDTVRCIPECEHCFHSECIDEWLRKQNTCPVCRNSPSPNGGLG